MRGNAPRESGGFRLSVVLRVDLYYPGGGSVLLRRLLLGLVAPPECIYTWLPD
jgi:hypothetical protein